MDIIKPNYVWNGELKERTSTDFFIVHHADWKYCDYLDIHNMHVKKGWVGIGYNYFISKTGAIFEGRPEWASDADARGYNYNSLSVCLEGDFVNEQIESEQRTALIELMLHAKEKYPNIKFLRHKDVSDTACPGDIGWVDILADVQNIEFLNNKRKIELEGFVTKREFYDLKRKVDRMSSEINKLQNQ